MKVPVGTMIYLNFGRKFLLPMNPEELTITHPSKNETYNVLGVGEVVVPMSPGLQEASWESFFPGDDNPFASGTGSPREAVKLLTRAKKNKVIGRLIVTRSGLFDTNLRCIIEEFETKDKGGEPNDIYYRITLKEYRSYDPQTVAIIQQPTTAEQPAQASAEPERPVDTPVLRVGAQAIANGKYYSSEYGEGPSGTANNLSTTVTRINQGKDYPVHIGSYGWLKESQLQIVG